MACKTVRPGSTEYQKTVHFDAGIVSGDLNMPNDMLFLT